MLSRFMPKKEDQFFELFKSLGVLMVEGSQVLSELFKDLPNAEKHSRRLKDIEHKADDVTHRSIDLLHRTFITPLDREDIHLLTSRMDDIIDFMDAAAQRVLLYDLKSVPSSAIELAQICEKSAIAIQQAVSRLSDMKNSTEILKLCVEINRLENESDHTFRTATAKLFREEPDTRHLIKCKEIFEMLETTTDRCEDVANIIEGIVLEYS